MPEPLTEKRSAFYEVKSHLHSGYMKTGNIGLLGEREVTYRAGVCEVSAAASTDHALDVAQTPDPSAGSSRLAATVIPVAHDGLVILCWTRRSQRGLVLVSHAVSYYQSHK
jgi:hypothetical protein